MTTWLPVLMRTSNCYYVVKSHVRSWLMISNFHCVLQSKHCRKEEQIVEGTSSGIVVKNQEKNYKVNWTSSKVGKSLKEDSQPVSHNLLLDDITNENLTVVIQWLIVKSLCYDYDYEGKYVKAMLQRPKFLINQQWLRLIHLNFLMIY